MQFPYRRQRLLRRIERGLRRSDPQLAAMLAVFAQLYASEVLASPEERATAHRMAWLGGAVSRLAAGLSSAAAALSRAARAAWRAARGRLGTAEHSGARAG
jgi:hypothetical protein